MSFLPIRQENEEAAQGQTTNTPAATEEPPQTGGSVGDEGGGAPAKGSATGTPTQFGSSASKLGDYLSANAPQIQNQADTLTNTLNTQYGNLNQGITDAANQFQQSVKGGYAAPDQGVVGQAIADPTTFAADPNNVKAFQAQYNNAYTGPTTFEGTGGYSDLQNQVGQAVTQGDLLGTQAGLQSYLQGQSKNPTQAMSTLDSLLLRGNPEAQQKIQTAAGQFGNLTGQLGTATAGADQSVLDAQKAAQDSAAYAQGQFGNAVTGFNSGLTNKLDAANAQNTKYNTDVTALRSALQSGQFGAGTGVDPHLQAFIKQYLDPMYAASAGYTNKPQLNYLNALGQNVNPQAPTLGGVANTQDYDTLAALGQLGGSPIQSQLSGNTASQAGTWAPSKIGDLDNKAIAQDLMDQVNNTSGDVSGKAGVLTGMPAGYQNNMFNNYNRNADALKQYLSGTIDPNYGKQNINPNGAPNWQYSYGNSALTDINQLPMVSLQPSVGQSGAFR